jgi:hypothetical protein
LVAWNFFSQNFLAPFSTLTNTPIINWGYLLFIQLGGCTQSFLLIILLAKWVYLLDAVIHDWWSLRNIRTHDVVRYLWGGG